MNHSTKMGVTALVVAAVLFATLAAAANIDLRPGEYALTVAHEVQDQRQSESRTAIRCITQSDLQNPEAIFSGLAADARENQDACEVKDLRTSRETISYDADCPNRLVHVEGKLRVSAFAVMRTVKSKTEPAVSLKFMIWGRRIGDCRPMQ